MQSREEVAFYQGRRWAELGYAPTVSPYGDDTPKLKHCWEQGFRSFKCDPSITWPLDEVKAG